MPGALARWGSRLRGLSPLGPIFAKELRTTARRKRTYLLRFGYLGLLLLGMLALHAVTRLEMNWVGRGVAWRAQQAARLGTYFFTFFAFFTTIAMALIGPVLTCTAINGERLHKTLPALLMTPITAWQIVAGKLFSRMLVALTLIGLSLPVLAIVRLLGGVELDQMFGAVILAAGIGIFAAALGLLYSTLVSRAYAVILLSYATMGFLWGLLPLMSALFVIEVVEVRNAVVLNRLFNLFELSNPFPALVMLTVEGAPLGVGVLGWPAPAATHAALAALLLLATAALLRRMARRENEGPSAPPPALPATGELPVASNQLPVPSFQLPASGSGNWQLGTGNSVVGDNPVLWRELRRPLLVRRWHRIATTLAVVGLLLLMYLLLGVDGDLLDEEIHIGFAIVFAGAFHLLACVLAGTAIAQEKESDTWTLLLATPLSGARIVWGKFAGLARRMLWPAVLIAAHTLLFTVCGVLTPAAAFVVLFLIACPAVLFLATGILFSLCFRTVTLAVILNLLVPVTAYGIMVPALAIAGVPFESNRRHNWAEAVALYCPYPYIVVVIDDFGMRGHVYRPRTIHYAMGLRLTREEFTALAFGVGIGHLALAGILLAAASRNFDRLVGRAGQELPDGLNKTTTTALSDG